MKKKKKGSEDRFQRVKSGNEGAKDEEIRVRKLLRRRNIQD